MFLLQTQVIVLFGVSAASSRLPYTPPESLPFSQARTFTMSVLQVLDIISDDFLTNDSTSNRKTHVFKNVFV